jgi:hypothetical protein
MRRILRHRPSPGTVFGLTALVVAIGGAAFAAIPDSNGTIHGCYNNNYGNLRVVESAADCRSNETALPWNQKGPPSGGSVVFSEETAEVTTSSPTFVDLGGPEVTVDVPASGLVNVYVRWEGIRRPNGSNIYSVCVGLFVDGQPAQLGNIFGDLAPSGIAGCVDKDESFERKPAKAFPIEASPGRHMVSLRYEGVCDVSDVRACADFSGAFRNRKLWVQPVG